MRPDAQISRSNPVSLEGKVALITGATRGIGRAVALLFAQMGADIIINYVKSDELAQEVAAQVETLGQRAFLIKADVAQREAVERMGEYVQSQVGEFDILVNNAGISLTNNLYGLTQEVWDQVIGTNLTGLFNTCQVLVPLIKKQGRIINISSIAGRRGSMFGDVHYAAAKAGVIGFTHTLARTLAPDITVNAVAPGVTVSDMLAENSAEHVDYIVKNTPMGRAATPEEVAGVCLFLASALSGYMTGVVLDVNGGNFMS
jgi:3-oxoacyl-[acyl-carrier protein] reductase